MIATKILRFLFIVPVMFIAFVAGAQDNHFVYLQSDNSQPFYVKVDGKLYSSTASGYVIISKLASGYYSLNIGFPKNEYPEAEYKISLDDRNEGFLLKKLDDGWVLFNTESMAVTERIKKEPVALPVEQVEIKVEEVKPPKTQIQENNSSDPFSTLLAAVVKDSSILKENRISIPTPVDTVIATQGVTEQPKAVEVDTAVSIVEVVEVKPVTEIKEEKIPIPENPFVRVLMVNESEGQDMVYVNKETKDTIRLFVPGDISAQKEKAGPGSQIIYNPDMPDTASLTITPTIVEAPVVNPAPKPVVKPKEKEESKGARIIYQPDKEVKDAVVETQKEKVAIVSSAVNSDCTAVADEKDFLKIRRRMAGESDNQKMVDAARRFFKLKCYTTEQIRNLSYLFLDDAGRYRFFDAAYPYTSDQDMFYTLEPLLKDPYFVNRFKAMISK